MASLEKFKLNAASWDTDKDPGGFPEFYYSMSSTVRGLKYGDEVEDYLDAKTGRVKLKSATTPSFIDLDPDFAMPQHPDDSVSTNNAEPDNLPPAPGPMSAPSHAMSGATAASGVSGMLMPAGSYWDLSTEARALDVYLYSVLKICIVGGKRVLLECVKYPSYIQGMCILHKHCDISKNDRITRAFDGVDRVTFNGDVTVWLTDIIKATRELFDSKATIMHYVLCRVLKSFDGKLKTIQYKIAQDINSRDINEHTNVYDMVQSYAVDIAAVGDSTQAGVAAIGESCTHCGGAGHLESSCWTKHPHLKPSGYSGTSGTADDRDCYYCKEKGHIATTCPKKKKDRKAKKAAKALIAAPGQAPPAVAAAVTPAVPPAAAPVQSAAAETNEVLRAGLAALLSKLQAPSAVQHIAVTPPVPPAAAPVQSAAGETNEVLHAGLAALLSKLQAPSAVQHISVEQMHERVEAVERTFAPVQDRSYLNVTSQGGHRGERVGEASHPGPYGTRHVVLHNGTQVKQEAQCRRIVVVLSYCVATVFSVCDGMGCGAAALQECEADMSRYVAVELNEEARKIAEFANPKTTSFPGIDHSVCNDMYDITEQTIIDMGPGNIVLFLGGTPCGDFSKLRMLLSTNDPSDSMEWVSKDPRPGLDGPNGKKLRQFIKIWMWVLKHNPNCEFMFENLVFDDMPGNWKEVCQALGEPTIVNSMLYSRTKRVRAFWNNFSIPIVLPKPSEPLDPQDCMLTGRVVHTYTANGTECVRPIGASWEGDPENPRANTRVPVLVDDELYDEPQHIKPEEAEALMGHRVGSTAAPGVSAKARLRCIGAGWDHIVATIVLSHSRICIANVSALADTKTSSETPSLSIMLEVINTAGTNEMAAILALMSSDEMLTCLGQLTQHYILIADGSCSVLDSGSAKHLHNRTRVLNADDRQALTGFDGSVQWSEGNGYLPIEVIDDYTGSRVALDVEDSELMTGTLIAQILSLGKLLRSGFDFHFSNHGKDCYAVTPGGVHKIRVELGVDDILRLRHTVRTGKSAVRIPMPGRSSVPAPAFVLKRRAADATVSFLHDVFYHCGEEKLYRTLGVTNGYKQVRIVLGYCSTCAQAKARNFGLRQNAVIAPVSAAADPVFDDDNNLDGGSDDDRYVEDEYEAAVVGRELGVQSVPRFNLVELRVWELMFVDNKDYPVPVRGGYKSTLVFIDYKSRAKAKIDVRSKKDNGKAMARIISLFGIHKRDYPCRVYTDGCGSMVYVKKVATRFGLDHAYTPPHMPNLNEAEKVCDRMWEGARAITLHSKSPDNLFGMAVDYVMYADFRAASTASRGWLTPYQAALGVVPDISKMHRWYTKCSVTVPKSKRKALAAKGLHNVRAESGRFVGFQSLCTTTYAVILDDDAIHVSTVGSSRRLVHSINVTFDDTDFTTNPGPDVMPIVNEYAFHNPGGSAGQGGAVAQGDVLSPDGFRHEEANPMYLPPTHVQIEPLPVIPTNAQSEFDLDDPAMQSFWYNETSPQPRPRPTYSNLVSLAYRDRSVLQNMVMLASNETSALKHTVDMLHTASPGFSEYYSVCHLMALHATKDIDWKRALASDQADQVIASYELEMESLTNTILSKIDENDPEYEVAVKFATPGRMLLDIRRSGMYKSRGVKQGFKEFNKAQFDGPDFNYYAHVAKLVSVRSALFRYKRGSRRLALKDVRTAFLQADKFPDGKHKYVCLKCPLNGVWEYFRQDGPMYGEDSAPVNWENTYSGFLTSDDKDAPNMTRGENEPCCYHQEDRDILALLWVDDTLADAEKDEVQWLFDKLDGRFDCKPNEWLDPVPGGHLDYLGITVVQDDKYVYASMESYIEKCLESLDFGDVKPVSTPIDSQIDGDSDPLSPELTQKYMTAIGMLGWLSLTVRCDISYAHSRLSQHQSKPTESAWKAVKRCFQYLSGTPNLGIRSPLYHDYDNEAVSDKVDPRNNYGWELFVDSDFASNDEPQNKRRSQNGYIILCNGAPVLWCSKVSSVAFADERIGEAHTDVSSGAAEVYAAGNAAHDIVHLSHVLDEMHIDFPSPACLQIDNTAAIAFTRNTAMRSKLKHIDVRQEWVHTLRDKNVLCPEHVPTEYNLADMFTKILSATIFIKLRSRVMHTVPSV
jgi:hypothetical protein